MRVLRNEIARDNYSDVVVVDDDGQRESGKLTILKWVVKNMNLN